MFARSLSRLSLVLAVLYIGTPEKGKSTALQLVSVVGSR